MCKRAIHASSLLHSWACDRFGAFACNRLRPASRQEQLGKERREEHPVKESRHKALLHTNDVTVYNGGAAASIGFA